MSVWMGWGLALLAGAVGYLGYGWRGLILAASVLAFWLLLQFSRALRALRRAAGQPLGQVDSALMLHARLHAGMPLVQILAITRSLGRKLADEPETFAWHDAAGDTVRVELRGGRLSAWALQRAGGACA